MRVLMLYRYLYDYIDQINSIVYLMGDAHFLCMKLSSDQKTIRPTLHQNQLLSSQKLCKMNHALCRHFSTNEKTTLIGDAVTQWQSSIFKSTILDICCENLFFYR